MKNQTLLVAGSIVGVIALIVIIFIVMTISTGNQSVRMVSQ